MRSIGIDPVHDTRETFRAVLSAMSRPGTVQRAPADPADRAVVATLVDHEVGCYTEDEGLAESLEREGRLDPRPLEEAAVVHVHGSTDGRAAAARRGTLKEPGRGATVVYRVGGVIEGVPAGNGTTGVELSGPGVPGSRSLAVAGLPAEEADAIAEAQSEYPRGIDVVFAAGDRIAAIPRSVELEVA